MKSVIERPSLVALPLLLALVLLCCADHDTTGLEPPPRRAGESPQDQPGEPAPAAVGRLEAVWENARAEGASAVALVRHRGQVLGAFEAGSSRRDEGLANTLETAFDIGSITKQFTGAAIMRLHEQGQLDLQAPLATLFDGVPEDKGAITVHQLLTHTAGFAGALGDDDEPVQRDEYLQRAWDRPLTAEPGSLHYYSNTGYSILGALIERVTGRSYDEYLRSEVLLPAGVSETGYIGLELEPSRVAVGYAEGEADDPLARPHPPDGYYWNLRANGGLLSTAADLARWFDALLGGEVLGAEALATYLTPHVREGLGSDARYAYGWAVSDTPAGRLYFHNGGNGYFYAEVRQYVDAELLVIVLANEESDVVLGLPDDLAHAVLPELPSASDLPEPPPLAIEREEILDGSSESFVESVELDAGQDRAVAGFLISLEAGSARYRVRAPGGDVYSQGQTRSGELLERLIVIPPRAGTWQLEVDTDAATGELFFAWVWD